MAHHGQKAKAILPYRRVIVIHDNTVEETVDRSPQPAKRLHRGKERLAILCPGSRFRQGCERAMQRNLGIFGEQARVSFGGKRLFGFAFLGIEDAGGATPAGKKAGPVVT